MSLRSPSAKAWSRKRPSVVRWLTLCALALFAVGCGDSPKGRVIRVNLIDSPPLEYEDESGRPKGFGVEILESIAELEDWEIEWVMGTWPEALGRLQSGEIDLLFPMLPTSERRTMYDFSKSSLFMTWGRVFANQGVKIEELADLTGKTVAVVEADFYGDEIRRMVVEFEIDCEIVALPSKNDVLREVKAGTYDAAAIEGFVSLSATDEYQLDMTPVIFAPAAPHVVALKGQHADVLERFDVQLTALRAEEGGVYERAFEEWFGFRDRVKYSPGGIWTLVVVITVLIALGIATLVLRKKVSRSTSELLTIGMRSRDILENMPVMLNAIGEDGLYVVWNKECARVAGYTAEEIIGNPNALEMLYPDPEYRAYVEKKSEELDYDYHNWERHYTAKDGSIRHLATSSISKRFPVPGWKAWGIAVDITERKKAEEDLKASELRLRLVTDNVPVLIAHWDAAGVFTFCNARADELLLMDREEVVGKLAREVLSDEIWNRARDWQQGDENHKQLSFETRWRNPKGERKDLAVMLVPDGTSTGEIQGCYALLADITGRIGAESARRKLEDQLRHSQKMEAIGELASGVAHDFRNLLTVIAAHTDHVRREVADNKVVLNSLDTVEEALAQASQVTRSLLTFSKKLDTVMVPLNLSETVEGTTKMIIRTMPASVTVDVHANLEPAPWVEADPTQIQQVLLNLVLNARDAMPDGGNLSIELHDHPTDVKFVQLIVRDSGYGMTPEISSRVFEPFFTTKAGERGTGLGLATVHGIIENHGGRIEVDTKPGKGAIFTITLPKTERRQEVHRERPRRIAPGGRGERILLAEHNHQVLQVVAATLKEFGFDVIKIRDSEQLQKMLESDGEPVRLLVVDTDLPKRSAIDLIRDLRERGDRVPVILLSTNTGPLAQDLLDEETVLLPKPFQMTELEHVVNRLLVSEETPIRGD